MEADDRAHVRSYVAVLDRVERRIYRVDRWRLPSPHGVSVRACAYAIVALAAVLAASRLPLLGLALGAMPTSIRLVAVPLGAGAGLAAWAPDGRAPHHALRGLVRHLVVPRTLSGLRPTAAAGHELVPIEEIRIAAAGDDPRYRPGLVRGPARVLLRYPARVALTGVARRVGPDPDERLARARAIEVSALESRVRPLVRAKALSVPAGKEVRFR
jgi:hypothetical protein